MARIARAVAVGYPHHITQKGNYGQKIFHSNTDRIKYLNWINEYSKKYKLIIISYCLMSNHVHMIVIPLKQESLAQLFKIVHTRYAQYLNKKRGKRGHLWKGRYYSCILDETLLFTAIKYVERNPVAAGMIACAWQYKWSSAAIHSGIRQSQILKLLPLNEYLGIHPNEWKKELSSPSCADSVEKLEKSTRQGIPYGDNSFIAKMELLTGKNFTPEKPVGRPRKKISSKISVCPQTKISDYSVS